MKKETLYIYIYTRMEIHPQKSTRHVEANVNTRKENQGNQRSRNEVEDRVICHKSELVMEVHYERKTKTIKTVVRKWKT